MIKHLLQLHITHKQLLIVSTFYSNVVHVDVKNNFYTKIYHICHTPISLEGWRCRHSSWTSVWGLSRSTVMLSMMDVEVTMAVWEACTRRPDTQETCGRPDLTDWTCISAVDADRTHILLKVTLTIIVNGSACSVEQGS